MMLIDEEYYSPYCELCTGCGEDGCCDALSCLSTLVKQTPKCKYGERYLKDLSFDRDLASLGYEIISKIENGLLSAELAVKEYHKEWDLLYNKTFINET